MLPFEYATSTNRIYKIIKDKNYDKFWSSHMKYIDLLDDQEHSMVQDFQDLF